MALDINTPKGQESRRQEDRAIELFEERFPNFLFNPTDKREPARPDGMIHMRKQDGRSGSLIALAEVKCRDMSLDTFVNKFKCEWIITNDKLEAIRKAALLLSANVTGLLYLTGEDRLIVQRIFNRDGSEATPIRREWTETQRTINGGKARRFNAYVTVNDPDGMVERSKKVEHSTVSDPECLRAMSQTFAQWVAEYEAHEEAA